MENATLPKTSAPYGRACINCVRAKCRCVIRNGDICERCHRLSKDCAPSTTVRKRSAKGTATSKRSHLEDKLDDIVTLLRTQNAAQPHSFSGGPSIPTPGSSNSSPTNTSIPYIQDANLTECHLANFRKDHLHYLPFVHLPPSITADHLQLERPILCLAIRTLCTKAKSRQNTLSTLLRETLASKILVNGERSIDLLLALTVCLTWSTYISHGKLFLGMMSGLARSLISDLRLDKFDSPADCPTIVPSVEVHGARTNEGRRALLTVFALSAIIATTFKYEPMPWSPAIEEAGDKLVKDEEAEGDRILVDIARIARISVNTIDVVRRALEDPGLAKYVVTTIGPLKSSLDSIRSTLTTKHLEHSTVIAFLYNAEINVYDISLLQPPPSYQHPSEYKRIEYLTFCMQTCKSVLDYFLPVDIAHIPGPSMIVFAYSIKVLYKLSTLEHDSGWDPRMVREAVNLVSILEQAAVVLDRANAKLKEETGEDSVLATAAEAMRNHAPNWRIMGPDIALDSATTLPEWNGGDGGDISTMDFSDNFILSGTFDF